MSFSWKKRVYLITAISSTYATSLANAAFCVYESILFVSENAAMMDRLNSQMNLILDLKNLTKSLGDVTLKLKSNLFSLERAGDHLQKRATRLENITSDLQDKTSYLVNSTGNLENQANKQEILSFNFQTESNRLTNLTKILVLRVSCLEETSRTVLNKTKKLKSFSSAIKSGASLAICDVLFCCVQHFLASLIKSLVFTVLLNK